MIKQLIIIVLKLYVMLTFYIWKGYLIIIILSNINNIRKIKFDFNNVDLIGPAFADELIRGLKQLTEDTQLMTA